MSNVTTMGGGEGAWRTLLLDKLWTPEEHCVWFVNKLLSLPMRLGGVWGGILSRPRKSLCNAQYGDIVVWAYPNPDQFWTQHAGVYLARNFVLHNGQNQYYEDARVQFCSVHLGNPRLRLYQGKPFPF